MQREYQNFDDQGWLVDSGSPSRARALLNLGLYMYRKQISLTKVNANSV